MTLTYYPETDSLYIDLAERPSAESREIAPGVVVDFDAEGKLVGQIWTTRARSSTLTPLDPIDMPVRGTGVA